MSGGLGVADRAFVVQQLIDRAVASSEIVDVLRAAGVEPPDSSILSDEFLAEIRGMERKNLALDALQKLLNGEIRSRANTNVVESRTFSRRLEDAVARYPANAISAVEMINELIALARDLQEARRRGEEQGLSAEDVAFYDALAQNESAIQALGNDTLRLIVHGLLEQLIAKATVDWHKRGSAGAWMPVLVKRILKKHGYPPDLADDAVKTV
ncbi:MAG: DUF3387 domain-containing protein, partial [Hyphomicrobiales bacterium]|nr:DUF3387 domain-containing protein [Hyphomicrobiales bacterium]